jgi:HD superfamily phosphodiesterase
MNSKDKKPDYKKIYLFVKEKFDKTNNFYHGPFDETYFTMRVFEEAKNIMRELKDKNIKKQEVLTAAILHDIGKTKLKPSKLFQGRRERETIREEWMRHAELGVPIAKNYLKKEGHSPDFIKNVCYLISNHDKRNLKEKTIELEIVQDADIIADIGFAGFIRPFLYASRFKRNTISTIEFLQTDNRFKDNHINLEASKKLGKIKMMRQKELAKEILEDIKCELIN